MTTTGAPTEEPTNSTIGTALGDVDCAVVGEGPPVLVVHGSPGGHDAGLAMARFLVPRGFRAIAPDRPGYFDTPLSSGETPDQQADLYAALLDVLGIDRAGVLCWSGGARRPTGWPTGTRIGSPRWSPAPRSVAGTRSRASRGPRSW